MSAWISRTCKGTAQGDCRAFNGSLPNRGNRLAHISVALTLGLAPFFSYCAFSQQASPVREAVYELQNTLSSADTAKAGAPQKMQNQGETCETPRVLLTHAGYVRGLAAPPGKHFGVSRRGPMSGISAAECFRREHTVLLGLANGDTVLTRYRKSEADTSMGSGIHQVCEVLRVCAGGIILYPRPAVHVQYGRAEGKV